MPVTSGFKYSFEFNLIAGNAGRPNTRTGGIGESYFNDTPPNSIGPAIYNLMGQRANLLSNQVTLVGYRVSDISVKNVSQLFHSNIPGTWVGAQAMDFPQACIQASGLGKHSNKQTLQLKLRGLPDEASKGGTIDTTLVSLQSRAKPFFDSLRDGNWWQIQTNMRADSVKIVNISGVGTANCEKPHPFANNARVTLLRMRDAVTGAKVRGGTVTITTGTNPLQFQVVGLVYPNGLKGGTARLQDVIANQYQDLNITDVGLRKVGKSFFSYRGKQRTAKARIV